MNFSKGHELNVRFPRTREEAEKVSTEIRTNVALRGCQCRSLKIEFIQPTVGDGYVSVGHERGCHLAPRES